MSVVFTATIIIIILVWFSCPTNMVCDLVDQATNGPQILPMSQKNSDTLVSGIVIWTVVLLYVIHKTIVIHDEKIIEEVKDEGGE